MMHKKITLVMRGKDEGALDESFECAIIQMRDGYLSGVDRNDDGSYYFNSTTEVPKKDQSA